METTRDPSGYDLGVVVGKLDFVIDIVTGMDKRVRHMELSQAKAWGAVWAISGIAGAIGAFVAQHLPIGSLLADTFN